MKRHRAQWHPDPIFRGEVKDRSEHRASRPGDRGIRCRPFAAILQKNGHGSGNIQDKRFQASGLRASRSIGYVLERVSKNPHCIRSRLQRVRKGTYLKARSVRARLQSCRKRPEKQGVSTPEVLCKNWAARKPYVAGEFAEIPVDPTSEGREALGTADREVGVTNSRGRARYPVCGLRRCSICGTESPTPGSLRQ